VAAHPGEGAAGILNDQARDGLVKVALLRLGKDRGKSEE
jgi:hypothetical protein